MRRSSLQACTQPQCLLRDEEVGPAFIADLIVRLMAGEDVDFSHEAFSERIITAKKRCIGCVLDVMRGKGPLPTVEELRRIEEGLRYHRRVRREYRREAHRISTRPSKAGL